MNDLRTAAQQALEAMRRAVPTGKITLADWSKAVSDLDAALAQEQAEPAPMPPLPPISQRQRGCAVCGIGADGEAYSKAYGKAYGYVCPRYDCPTKVTWGGAV